MAKEKSRHPWHLAEPPAEGLGDTGLTSRELVRKFRGGEGDAARRIVDRYTRRLVALARKQLAPKLSARLDPEDVVQSAFRSFFVRAGAGAFVFERAGDLWRLLAQITVNKARAQAGFHSAEKRDVTKDQPLEAFDSTYMHHEPTPVEVAIAKELVTKSLAKLDALPRRILQLRLSGATIPAIALEVGRSQRTVRRLLCEIKVDLWSARTSMERERE